MSRKHDLEALADAVREGLRGGPDHPWIPGATARPVQAALEQLDSRPRSTFPEVLLAGSAAVLLLALLVSFTVNMLTGAALWAMVDVVASAGVMGAAVVALDRRKR